MQGGNKRPPPEEAGRHRVVRAVVDHLSQRAALLLADASCRLVALGGGGGGGGGGGAKAITVPAPCSDVCFLRLQAYARCSTSRLGFGVRREVCVVTSRPGKGGACTDLRAWSCVEDGAAAGFSGVEVEVGRGAGGARLEAPHGLAVKMAASVNVLVVYSSAAGKFWVLAGKWSDQNTGGTEESERRRLVLMKCAVVSCYGPVYSIHVSSLHLFLGESKGVRVWSLRPLIKPGSSGKSSSRSRLQGGASSEQGSPQSSENCGRVMDSSLEKKSATGNGSRSVEENMVKIGGVAMKKVSSKNKGLRTNVVGAGLGNYHPSPKVGSGAYPRFSNFEFRSLSELQAVFKTGLPAEDDVEGKKTYENGGGGVIKNETHNGILRSYPAEHEDISIKETLVCPKLRDHMEGDWAASTAEVFQSHECNGDHSLKTPPRQRNGLTPVAESLLEAQILSRKKALHQSAESVLASVSRGGQSRKVMKESDSAGVWFVSLGGEEEVATTQSSSHAGRRPGSQLQVVDIQGLGLKEYIVLDSKGKLHLLTLHEVSEGQKSEYSRRTYLTIRHLRSTMRVTSFAVLPLPPPPPLPQAHQDFFSPAALTAKRKLWISDGMYSIHVVLLPEEDIKVITDSSSTEATLPVSQVVFAKDRVDGIVAGSPDTVVVVMKGRLVSYVIPGD